jgi:23S rRNA pseudouridine1911/1915/1917 synthase
MSSEKSKIRKFIVSPPGGRLDRQLAEQLVEYSRSRLQKFIRAGHVTVDHVIIRKSGHQLQGGEQVEVEIPASLPPKFREEDIPLSIIYEDDDLLLINKPAGMVVHPSHGHDAGTLVQAALAYAPGIRSLNSEARPGVVHRLDKDTSGLILMAKTDLALVHLQKQFISHEVQKEYSALVDGHPEKPIGRIEGAIGRDPRDRKKMAIVPESRGRSAETLYRTVENFSAHALLRVEPKTGRTHQIRVHLASIGVPVTGDLVYGHRRPTVKLKRHFLHARRLTFRLPESGELINFEAPLPQELELVISAIRAKDA